MPLNARDGGFVKTGHSAELDDNRKLRNETKQVIAGLQANYAELSGVKSLKIRHNNVLGYFIEVPAGSAAVLQDAGHAATFIHRQTIASAVRFVTTELATLDQRIGEAGERCLEIEMEIFGRLVNMVINRRDQLSNIANACAEIDAASALGELAERRRYTRPKVDGSLAFAVTGGRHPVVEAALQQTAAGSFVANDCDLSGDAKRLWLLTGPNMAGKSTFLRQNALIVILAQMGSFVPAARAHIGTVDRLFSRVGASDDLARGRSTFMVEMVETASILNQAGPRSLVILDEIGRGTATFDGLSIAWAAIEHLHEANRCRTLFATHFHELTALAGRLPRLHNVTIRVKEWQGDVIFLHEVVPGVADRSYGIQVARLAGLPEPVIERAREVLEKLENAETGTSATALADELPLFSTTVRKAPAPAARENPALALLRAILPDELSPREALEKLYELKKVLERE
jgi:DNA mismatch repair protein MutS